jgi:hypothetical protein
MSSKKKNKRNFYLFFLKENEDDSFHIDGIYPNDIYAYTDNPTLAYQFISTRNMDIFNYDIKKLNKHDINNLCRENQLQNLISVNLMTKNFKYKIKNVSIVITEQERNNISIQNEFIMHEEIFRYTWTNENIFNNLYKQMLTKLMYVGMRNFLSTGGEGLKYILSNYRMKSDMLAILYDMYGGLFKLGDDE